MRAAGSAVDRYVPANPPADPRALNAYLQQELSRISAFLGSVDTIQLNPLAVEPSKPREGLEAYADGSNWDPGSGPGRYEYSSGAWEFLRGGTGVGTGDVVGPASAVANRIAVFNGTTGKLIKDGGATVAALVPYTGAAGAVDLGANGITAQGATLTDNLTVPKTSGKGIKVDAAAPTFGWRDLLGMILPKVVGAGTPTLAAYSGGSVREFWFAANDVIDVDYHIPHDYVPGTDLHVHVHWSHNGTTIAGDAVFDISFTYAKGHNQANFAAEKTLSITYATTDIATTPQYRHRLDEAQLSTSGGSATQLDTDAIEPDGLIMLQMKLNTLPTIGGGGHLFVHMIDIHYQSSNVATKQKAPDFYT